MRTVVTFWSDAFNTSETKTYFINPGCYGDDLARWMMARMRAAGIQTNDEPGQEDFGWYFEFTVPAGRYCLVLGFRPEDPEPGTWIGWPERSLGCLGTILGGRRRGIAPSATVAIHAALQAPEIRNVRWHSKKDFDAGREELGASTP